MTTKISSPLKTTVCLAALSGMRAVSAPLWVCTYAAKKNPGKNLLTCLQYASIGEMMFDKSPLAPNRIALISLAGRAASGAVAGLAVNKKSQMKWKMAFWGATVAVASSFASFYLRKYIGKKYKVADTTIGAMEDALVLLTGACLTMRKAKS